MKLFIDSGVLLEMYQLSGPDLEELRKLVKLVETGKIELLLSQQVVDEFWRNREGVIADALKRFCESGAQASIPNIFRSYSVEAAELERAVAAVNVAVKDLEAKVNQDVAANTLGADEIILQLFAATLAEPTDAFVSAARRRVDIGNPPGKAECLGHAIKWEWLLNRGIQLDTTEIVILSTDSDYESQLIKGELKEYLRLDWAKRYPYCELRLERSLAKFLLREFPDTKLVDEA
jgi:hypothetical protein